MTLPFLRRLQQHLLPEKRQKRAGLLYAVTVSSLTVVQDDGTPDLLPQPRAKALSDRHSWRRTPESKIPLNLAVKQEMYVLFGDSTDCEVVTICSADLGNFWPGRHTGMADAANI